MGVHDSLVQNPEGRQTKQSAEGSSVTFRKLLEILLNEYSFSHSVIQLLI